MTTLVNVQQLSWFVEHTSPNQMDVLNPNAKKVREIPAES